MSFSAMPIKMTHSRKMVIAVMGCIAYQSKSEFSMYFSTSNLVSSVVSENASSISAESASSSKRGSIIEEIRLTLLIYMKKAPRGGMLCKFVYWHKS